MAQDGGFNLEWSLEGEKQLSRVMVGINTKLKDFSKPFKNASDRLKTIFSKDVFETEGGAIQERWKRLSPYTVSQKARLGFPPNPLVRTGRMQKGFRTIVDSDKAVIYNEMEYFKYHQSNQPRSKIPRRVMMKLGDQQKQIVIKAFQKYFHELSQY